MALIGEQFDETEDICGIVASVRQRGDKLALWTRTASNEAVQVGFGSHTNSVITFDNDILLCIIEFLFVSLMKKGLN
jgi:translation initiation factor 4E/cellulose synthase A